MTSSSGKYYPNLDHIRAVAAFMVFSWHLITFKARAEVPIPPLSLLAEGHCGVSLFMVLSGYLFAKLLNGKSIDYPKFIWNRILRLLPLLVFVMVVAGILKNHQGEDMRAYLHGLLTGILGKGFPNGGWSVAIEFHFYLLLPVLLYFDRRFRPFLPLLLVTMIGVRYLVRLQTGEVQDAAYFSLLGRIDQFICGILAYNYSRFFKGRHWLAACAFAAISAFYFFFDRAGGFHGMPSYPSPSLVWVFIPSVEAVTFGILIAWYAESFVFKGNRFLKLLELAGGYSYSIYLLHFFFFPKMSVASVKLGLPVDDFYTALPISLMFFICMIPVGYISYHCIEKPFMRFRKHYIRE